MTPRLIVDNAGVKVPINATGRDKDRSGDGGSGRGQMEQRLNRLEERMDKVDDRLRGVEINLAKLTERVGHLPSKGFIVGATMGGVAFITGIMIFLERIWDFVGPAAGN